ncbi:MAG: RNA methyltransferase [Clostridia bacterium]|nr:RNA methyltransferase [Clostridia bacterium]
MEIITSRKNPYIKELYAVKKAGKKSELCLIEGYKLISEAIKSGVEIKALLISDAYGGKMPDMGESGVRTITVNDSIIGLLSQTSAPQGITALIKKRVFKEIRSTGEEDGVYILLDEVSDPGNVGTVIRTAEAFGVRGVVLCGACADVYNDKTLRATMGSAFRQPVFYEPNAVSAVKKLKSMGARVYAAALEKDAKRLGGFEPSKLSAFVIGNEARGVSLEALNECDDAVIIPMSGETESLNAAVSAGVIMWETAGRRA